MFVITYVNLYQQLGSNNRTGRQLELEVGVASYLIETYFFIKAPPTRHQKKKRKKKKNKNSAEGVIAPAGAKVTAGWPHIFSNQIS